LYDSYLNAPRHSVYSLIAHHTHTNTPSHTHTHHNHHRKLWTLANISMSASHSYLY